MAKKVTTRTVREWKNSDHKISVLTAYDATFAALLEDAGIDIILVGDSAGNVVAGYDTTLPMTMDNMIYHVSSVKRGTKNALIVADMPFGSFQISIEQGVANAVRFMKETGADAVKLEGGKRSAPLVKRLTENGIPVMGHLGLTPQSINEFGSYKTQAADEKSAKALVEDALALEEAGIFSLVLEKIPADLAGEITGKVSVPTIGIGAGVHCDGQVLVLYDMLGLYDKFRPRFVRRYAELGATVRDAVSKYIADIQSGSFPNQDESY